MHSHVRTRQQTKASSWIQSSPEICGGDACVRNTRHTVAGLVQWQKLGLSDAEILGHHPDLSQDDLDAAWEYYQKHTEEVEQTIHDDRPPTTTLGEVI